MKFTRVVMLCNMCWDETGGDVETPAEYTLIYKLSDDSDTWYRLDVCETHAENGTSLSLLIGVAEKIDPTATGAPRTLGRPRKAAALDMTEPAASPFVSRLTPCPECGKDFRGAGGIAVHMKSKHPDAWDQIVLERNRETERKRAQTALNRMAEDAVPDESGE